MDVSQLSYIQFIVIGGVMSTTTIRLTDGLKTRVAAAAVHAGTTSHNFILQAIVEKTLQEEFRYNFNEEAEKRYAKIIATGETIPWQEMRCYLENSLTAEPHKIRPVARKLGC